MILRVALVLGVLGLVGGGAAQTRDGYNLWGKERIRFLYTQVQLRPGDARLRVRLAKALYEDGRRNEAEGYLRQALELQPDLAEGHCNLGVILQARAQLGEARRHYEEALRLDSTLVEAMAGLGVVLCRSQHAGQGLSLLERVVALNPDGMLARHNLAVAYHQAGRLDQARAAFAALLRADPHYPGARQALAQVHYSQGLRYLQDDQPQEALLSFGQARDQGAQGEELLFAEGLANMRLRRYSQAEGAFKALLALQADHVPALRNLGLICEETNRPQEAVAYYAQVRSLALTAEPPPPSP
jgi:tetratricopeptide (TPR) repeat protein